MIEDKLLILRAKRGSDRALTRVYEKYKNYLLTVSTALLNDVSLAEDSVHDVFVSFAKSISEFELTGSLKKYLAVCVTNRVHNMNKSIKPLHFAAGQAEPFVSGSCRPEQAVILTECSARINMALAQLNYEQREVVTTDDMDKWVRADVLGVITKAKQKKSLEDGTIMWKRRFVKIAIAAVVLIGIFVGLEYVGHSVDIVTPAFAKAVRPILLARTATFKVTNEGLDGRPPLSMKGMFAEPGRMRFEVTGAIEMVQLFDMQKGQIIHLMPKNKSARVTQLASLPIEAQRNASLFLDIRRQFQDAVDANNGEVEFLGARQIDGVEAQGYLFAEKLGIKAIFWVDAASQRPVRIDYASELLGTTMKVVLSDFEFDVPLDESLFDLQIPDGYTVETVDMDVSQALEKDLIEMFRVWADATGGRFPSALSLNVDVLGEFTTTLTRDLLIPEPSKIPENKEDFYRILGEVKHNLTVLQGIIQNDDTLEDLLAQRVTSNLKELLDFKRQQEEAQQQYLEALRSRSENLSSNPLKHVNETQGKMKPIMRGLMFVQALPVDSDWHYAGKPAKYGDASTPIFWYRPKDLGVCRIIYGDLRLEDVPFDEQPEEPEILVEALSKDTKTVARSIERFRFERTLRGENEFIETLQIWTRVIDGGFPASLALEDVRKDIYDYQKTWLRKDGRLPFGQKIAPIRQDMIDSLREIQSYISSGLMFVRMLDADNDWHYAGKGVHVGDSDKAIFWYMPKGRNAYRVIYADLTVKETTIDHLPVDSGKTQEYDDIHEDNR